MTRNDIINALIRKFGYKSYLEIGLDDTVNFRAVQCIYKESVDPYFTDENGNNGERVVIDENGELLPYIKECLTFRGTSDEYFAQSQNKFDLIFIDGLHTKEQVYKDICNALKHLNSNGMIVCHDCLPENFEAQLIPRLAKGQEWNGDVWKAIVTLIDMGIVLNVVDTDYGCGIIPYTTIELPDVNRVAFIHEYHECFVSKYVRNKVLNVISPEDFEKFISL